MTISPEIDKYIENSKIKGILCKWDKTPINVFITEITANVPNKNFLYSEVLRAMQLWNQELNKLSIPIRFEQTQRAENADIVIRWTKVGRVFEGMCKYPSIINGIIKKIFIEIGLYNEFSGKNITEESIFSAILHEFGHALGLGHGVDFDDIMFVPHQKNVKTPSENDLYVLQRIYKF